MAFEYPTPDKWEIQHGDSIKTVRIHVGIKFGSSHHELCSVLSLRLFPDRNQPKVGSWLPLGLTLDHFFTKADDTHAFNIPNLLLAHGVLSPATNVAQEGRRRK